MLINEYRKMWNFKILAVVIAVGIAMFFSGPVSQMNLEKSLPLFETVEASIGTEFRQKYGKELDAGEMEEIKELAQAKSEALNEEVMKAFPEIKEAGFESYNALKEYLENADLETIETKEYEDAVGFEQKIYEQFLWEVEEVQYYYQGLINSYEWSSDKESYVVSVVPSSVTSNMSFVMGDFAGVVLSLVILFVIPYLSWDNRAGVYPIIATTKIGRKMLLKQIAVMLSSVAVLLLVCNLVFAATVSVMTPYGPFWDCIPDCVSYDWTLTQLYIMQVIIIDIVAIEVAMIVFFLSAFCETVVSIVAVIIPCWFAGNFMSNFFLRKTFMKFDVAFDLYESWQRRFASAPLLVCAVLMAVGVGLLVGLYGKRKKEDIFE